MCFATFCAFKQMAEREIPMKEALLLDFKFFNAIVIFFLLKRAIEPDKIAADWTSGLLNFHIPCGTATDCCPSTTS